MVTPKRAVQAARRWALAGSATVAGTCLVLALASLDALGQDAGQDKEAQVKAAIEGYAANRESFGYLTCRYVTTDAKTRTLEDALKGRNYLERFVSRGRFLMDGPKVLKEVEVDPSVMEKALKKGMRRQGNLVSGSVPASARGYLADGTNSFCYSPDIRCANIWPPEAPQLGEVITILALGNGTRQYCYGPDYQMELCQKGEEVFWPKGLREIDGHVGVCVLFGNAKKQPMEEYTFDVERGFLPLRILTYEVAKNREFSADYVTHVRECSRGRWFPERSVQVWFPYPDREALFEVRETKVTELDVDHRPKASDFTITVQAGTNMVSPVDQMGMFRLKQDEAINIADLARLREMCKKALQTPLMDTAVHPPDKYRWLRWTVIVLTACVLLGLAALRVRRRLARTAG